MRFLIVQNDCYIVHGAVGDQGETLHVTLLDLAVFPPIGRMAGLIQAIGKKMNSYDSFTQEESLSFTRGAWREYRRLGGDAPDLYNEFLDMDADTPFTIFPTTERGRERIKEIKAMTVLNP